MRKFIIPLTFYVILSAVYLFTSAAPLRVHVLSLSILVLALLIPSTWAAHMPSVKLRWLVCGLFALSAVFAWDITAQFVIVKAEPFFILVNNPLVFILGVIGLALLSYAVSWLAAMPNPAFKRDALKRAP